MENQNITEINQNEQNEPIKNEPEIVEKKPHKEYMKEYYAKNKDVLIKKMMAKEMCPHCSRMVAHQQLFKHQKTKYCKSRRELNDSFKRT